MWHTEINTRRITTFCLLFDCLLLIFFVSACMTVPTQQDIANADYGEYPSDLERIVTDHLKNVLFDPDSLKNLQITGLRKGWSHTNYGKDIIYGYWVDVSCNAKNRFGGYIGQKSYCAFIRNGHVDQMWSYEENSFLCPK